MPKPTTILKFGTEVDVIHGTELIRGLVVGRRRGTSPMYDVQPHGTTHLSQRLYYVPHESIRLIPEPLITVIPAHSIPRLVKAD